MKKTFWNKLTARGTRGKTRCAAAVLALAMTFSMGAPLALAAQPEESTAAVTETVSAQQETAMPTLQTETPELAAQDPEAPPVQATEAEENSTNQHTPENSVVLTPEEIRAALDAGAMDAAEAQCIDLSDENGFFSWLLNFLFGWLGKDESQPEPAYSGWRTSGGKTYYYSQTTNKPVTGIQCIDNKLYYFNADGVLENGKTFGVDVSNVGNLNEKLTVLRESYEREMKQEVKRLKAERQEMLDEAKLWYRERMGELREENADLSMRLREEQRRADKAEYSLIVQENEIMEWERITT